jgi:hypothetical protein
MSVVEFGGVGHQVNEAAHPVWSQTFDYGVRQTQLSDDATAWRRVCGVLLSVVLMGVILMAVTVLITLL